MLCLGLIFKARPKSLALLPEALALPPKALALLSLALALYLLIIIIIIAGQFLTRRNTREVILALLTSLSSSKYFLHRKVLSVVTVKLYYIN